MCITYKLNSLIATGTIPPPVSSLIVVVPDLKITRDLVLRSFLLKNWHTLIICEDFNDLELCFFITRIKSKRTYLAARLYLSSLHLSRNQRPFSCIIWCRVADSESPRGEGACQSYSAVIHAGLLLSVPSSYVAVKLLWE